MGEENHNKSKIDPALVEKILADKELTEKILSEKNSRLAKAEGTVTENKKPEGRKAVNIQAIWVVAIVLAYFILGIFITSPFLQLMERIISDLADKNWMAGMVGSIDELRFYNMYHSMIRAISIFVYLSAAFLYICWIIRIAVEYKKIKGDFSKYMMKLLPFLTFLLFDVAIIVVTIVRGPNEYDLTGHPYMGESIFSYILYPISYFFCGMMLYHAKWKKILLYVMVFTAFPVHFLALLVEFGVPFPYYFEHTKHQTLAVFHQFNHYGYYLAFTIMISALLFVYEKRKALKVVLFISMCLATMVLVINNTLGAYLATGFVLTMFFIYTLVDNRRKIKAGEMEKRTEIKGYLKAVGECGTWQAALFLLLFFVLFTILLNIHYHTVLESVFKLLTDTGDIVKDPLEADSAGTGRWKLWKDTASHIPEHPLVGFGVEGLLNTYRVGTPHNELLQYTAFFGIPVTLLYITSCAIVLIRVWKKRKVMNPVTMVCFFLAIGYLVNSLFGVAMYYTTPFLYIFLGLTYAEYLKKE